MPIDSSFLLGECLNIVRGYEILQEAARPCCLHCGCSILLGGIDLPSYGVCRVYVAVFSVQPVLDEGNLIKA